MRKNCPTCLGLGLIPVIKPIPMPCPDCNGLGYIEIEDEDDDPIECVCGCHPSVQFTVMDGWHVYCPNCGRESEGSCDRHEALVGWEIVLNKEKDD